MTQPRNTLPPRLVLTPEEEQDLLAEGWTADDIEDALVTLDFIEAETAAPDRRAAEIRAIFDTRPKPC